MDIASIVPINIGRGWGEGSHQPARPFGKGGWSCPAPSPQPSPEGEGASNGARYSPHGAAASHAPRPSPQPSPARGEGARSPFDQGRYYYFNGIVVSPDATKPPVVLLGGGGGKIRSGRVLDHRSEPNRKIC